MSEGSWGHSLSQYISDQNTHGLRIPTGFPTIDGVLAGGLAIGRFYMVLGRTSVGKSNLLFNMAYNALSADYSVAIISLEMSTAEVLERMLSIHADVDVNRVPNILLSDQPEEIVLTSLDKCQNLFINDQSSHTIDSIDKWIEDINQQHPPVRLLIVDHMLLMAQSGASEITAAHTQRLADDLKAFAKYSETALLTAHQVNRSVGRETDDGHMPITLSRGMYGGEQASSVSFGVYRPCKEPNLSPMAYEAMQNDLVLQIVKNRHGQELPHGVPLYWNLPSMRTYEKGTGDAKSIARTSSRSAETNHVVDAAPEGAAPGTASYDTKSVRDLRSGIWR